MESHSLVENRHNTESHTQSKQLSLNFHVACNSVFNGGKFVRVYLQIEVGVLWPCHDIQCDVQGCIIVTVKKVCLVISNVETHNTNLETLQSFMILSIKLISLI